MKVAPRFPNGPTLTPDLLAFARRKRPQEVLETSIPPILPVVLRALPLQHPGPPPRLPLVVLAKCHVNGRQGVAQRKIPSGAKQHGPRVLPVLPTAPRNKQSRAGDRREWNRTLQLRVVVSAHRLQGMGPLEIEHVLALTVRLDIHRHGAKHPSILRFRNQVTRHPSRFSRSAAASLKGAQPSVIDKRIRAPDVRSAFGVRASVPFGHRATPDVSNHPNADYARR